jgi:hypothetical protein
MEYFQQTINSELLENIFPLPSSLKGRMITVLIRPFVKQGVTEKQVSAFGCFHQFADSAKIASEKDCWEKAAVKNYEET